MNAGRFLLDKLVGQLRRLLLQLLDLNAELLLEGRQDLVVQAYLEINDDQRASQREVGCV